MPVEINEQTIKDVVVGAVSRDPEHQKDVITSAFAPDLKFHHFLIKCSDRDSYLKCFRFFAQVGGPGPLPVYALKHNPLIALLTCHAGD